MSSRARRSPRSSATAARLSAATPDPHSFPCARSRAMVSSKRASASSRSPCSNAITPRFESAPAAAASSPSSRRSAMLSSRSDRAASKSPSPRLIEPRLLSAEATRLRSPCSRKTARLRPTSSAARSGSPRWSRRTPSAYSGRARSSSGTPSVRASRSVRRPQPSRAWPCVYQNHPSAPPRRSAVSSSPLAADESERRAEVVVLGLEPVEPEELVARPQALVGLFGEAGELERVAAEQVLVVAGVKEMFQCVLADGRQHREARLARSVLGFPQEAPVDERPDSFQHIGRGLAGGSDNALGRLECEAAHEDRQARVQAALFVGEEVVTPGDRLANGALARRHVRASRGRELETTLQAAEERRGRQHLAPGSRELDGERKPVEPLADLGDNRSRLVRQLEVGTDRAGPLHEQHHRLVLGGLQSRLHTGGWKAQRRHGVLTLGGDAERLAARDQRLETGTAPEKVAKQA